MSVVAERPCGYCGAKAGQECSGYGMSDGGIHMARIRPEWTDTRPAAQPSAALLLQAAEAALRELVYLDAAPIVRGALRDAIRKARET